MDLFLPNGYLGVSVFWKGSMQRARFSILQSIFIFTMLFSTISACADVPKVFHWFHLSEKPLSEKEVFAIRSWQKLHPGWEYKLWTEARPSNRSIVVCAPPKGVEDLDSARKYALDKEGGIALSLELVCCKSVDWLCSSAAPFQTADPNLVLGCSAGQYGAQRKVLDEAFVLPDQIFTTEVSPSAKNGVCFRTISRFQRSMRSCERSILCRLRSIGRYRTTFDC